MPKTLNKAQMELLATAVMHEEFSSESGDPEDTRIAHANVVTLNGLFAEAGYEVPAFLDYEEILWGDR